MASKMRRVELNDTLRRLPDETLRQMAFVRKSSEGSAATSRRTPSSSATLPASTSPSLPGTVASRPRRRTTRVALDGAAVPLQARLRSLKVTQKTLTSYYNHIADFEAWARRRRINVNLNNLDRHVTAYLTFLFEDGETQPSTGAYLVYELQLLRCKGPKQAFLPNSKEALAGWRKMEPGNMRLPVPEEFVLDAATLALEQDRVDIALVMVIQLDTYLRPTECVSLTRDHFALPAGRRYKHWAIVVAPSELGETTKTGSSDDSVLVADLEERAWLRQALKLWVPLASGRVFPKLSLAQLEQWCKAACQQLRYKSCCVMPHILRHSGASNDVYHKRRDLTSVQKRGRWQARKSVTRYEKHALLQRRWSQAAPDRLSAIRRRSQQFPNYLLERLRTTGKAK